MFKCTALCCPTLADPNEVLDNLAHNKPTFQTDVSHGGVSSRAVDGNNNPDWKANSCTHTKSKDQAWWAVDLGKLTAINRVDITNRHDSCCGMLQLLFL